jgi:YVTN family beta-propeller protein
MNQTSRRKRRLVLFTALTGMLVLTSIGIFTTSADINVTNQPASEGRPITPAGSLVRDATTRQPAIGALPVDFVRSPDRDGADKKGRYLLAVNSGFGIQFNAATNRAQQSLSVIDLNAQPEPIVIQNVYFPAPQSVNVGVCFSPQAEADGSYTLYVSGGFENKIWTFRFRSGAPTPVTPVSPGPNTTVEAPFIDVSGFATSAPSPRYNGKRAPVYPAGLAISADGQTLFVANNLGDSLGVISDLRGARTLERFDLPGREGEHREGQDHFTYPYAVAAVPRRSPVARGASTLARNGTEKAYVSLWNDASIAVVDPGTVEEAQEQTRGASNAPDSSNGISTRVKAYIPVARHPTAMILNSRKSRLFVVNSDADSVSVIDTETDKEVERINVRLSENASLLGDSPEGLALSDDDATLYVANAHSNSVAVIRLSAQASAKGTIAGPASESASRSRVGGFIPTGQYPSAIAFAGGALFVGNGKGTGFENSSGVVNNSGRVPNAPNDRFPVGKGRGMGRGGQYSVSLVAGNISRIGEPDERALATYSQQVMRNNGLLGAARTKLFRGATPIKHVIYIIKENRTYDQVFGDIEHSGDGKPADGDATLAIFGRGEAARPRNGATQDVTPNHRELALRFGLLDRFFVNSEASPDGHNWSTAAFSSDYVDKAYRWDYGGRGRTYDYEGFNRLPNYSPMKDAPPLFRKPVEAADVTDYVSKFVPYLHNSRDVGEPESLYLWDACARAGLTYRNYGEFIGTLSEADVAAINANRAKPYPDLSQNVSALPTKKSLEGHYNAKSRNFDMSTPDSMTVESYRAAKESGATIDPAITNNNAKEQWRGNSRLGTWLEEFQGFVADREAGRPDRMPNLSMLRMSNDHTAGLAPGMPTPQFFVADNDYAIGRLVETVSNSPYWKDTAIFIVEDDAQDGPDHVDAHRSVSLVISAYNRPGALVHEFHNTVSLIRTMELLLGISPMNQLDATATPIDLFRDEADLRPYKAQLPNISFDNLMTAPARDAATAQWMKVSAAQDLTHADMADAGELNRIIWFSVRGASEPMPEIARLPAFDVLLVGIADEEEEEEKREKETEVAAIKQLRHRRQTSDPED